MHYENNMEKNMYGYCSFGKFEKYTFVEGGFFDAWMYYVEDREDLPRNSSDTMIMKENGNG